jgi:nucleotide-binding universal stress UspA family protein
MAYKTVLTVVTGPKPDMTQLDAAVSLARREDAHLDVLCLGVDLTQTGYYYAGATAIILQETLDQARAESEAAETAVRARLAAEDVRWAVDKGVAPLATLAGIVANRARFSDLAVLTKPYGPEAIHSSEIVLEAAMFDGHCPVLVLPGTGLGRTLGTRVVLAWNQSDEALVAAKAALPMLKAAKAVNISVVDPPVHGPERSDAGGPLSQYLSRHGVKAEVSVLAKTVPQIADQLCGHARDIDADMIVMGAYGHSRFREAILGGATRRMLEIATVPVFMAH